MLIAKLKNKIISYLVYGARRDSESFVKYLKKMGIKVGEGTAFYDPPSNVIDIQNPLMLTIGKNVRVTHGVVILTHDYSWSVCSGAYGKCLGNVAPVKIGDNVFIGMNTIILNNVTIKDNVIIGAGSVVTKDCESGWVYAGVPAKKIISLEDYCRRRVSQQEKEAMRIIDLTSEYGYETVRNSLREYSILFEDSDENEIKKSMSDTGYYEKCMREYDNQNYRRLNIKKIIESRRMEK